MANYALPKPLEEIREATPSSFKTNPYPKYANPLPGNNPSVKTVQYTGGEMVYDPVMASEIPIDDAIKNAREENTIIVKIGNTYSLLYRAVLVGDFADGSAVRYGCTKELKLSVTPADIYGKNPLVYLTGFQSGNFLVRYTQLADVFHPRPIAIELTPTQDTFQNVTSAKSVLRRAGETTGFFGPRVNLVGSDHCQAGSNQTVYDMTPLNLVKARAGRKRRMTRRSKKGGRTRRRRS